MKLSWKQDPRKFTFGEILFLGNVAVGTAFYDSSRSKNDPAKYESRCGLPGRSGSKHFTSLEAAKSAVEADVSSWVKEAGFGKEPS